MWYIESGAIKGVSYEKSLEAGFLELFDAYIKQTGHFPDLGVLGAASTQGFGFTPGNTTFFMTEWALFKAGRIPKMSHGFDSVAEHWESLFEGLPDIDDIKGLVEQRQDAILDAEYIDAPNSREDVWDNVIEIPDDYKWPDENAGNDASTLGS